MLDGDADRSARMENLEGVRLVSTSETMGTVAGKPLHTGNASEVATADVPRIDTIGTLRQLAVAIVEDDLNLMQHYCGLIEASQNMRVVGTATDVREGLKLVREVRVDVLLCDLGLPDGSGVDVVRVAVEQQPDIQVLVVTLFSDNDSVFNAIEAGAAGYLLKDALPDQFENTIRDVANGGCPINPGIARRLLRAFGERKSVTEQAPTKPVEVPSATSENTLSTREKEILGLLAKGMSFANIAALLFISPHTATAHGRRIYQKLAVKSRGEAVFEARQMGIIVG